MACKECWLGEKYQLSITISGNSMAELEQKVYRYYKHLAEQKETDTPFALVDLPGHDGMRVGVYGSDPWG